MPTGKEENMRASTVIGATRVARSGDRCECCDHDDHRELVWSQALDEGMGGFICADQSACRVRFNQEAERWSAWLRGDGGDADYPFYDHDE